MSERKYSVTELDALRRACETKWLWGSYTIRGSMALSRQYKEEEKTKCVEEIVRTHMIAGQTAEDLYASEQETEQPATNPTSKAE